MEFYAVLIALTAIVVVLAVLLYVKTREVAYLVGLALQYYFSLLAAWSLIGQRIAGTTTSQLMNLSQVLGFVNLDANYFWTLTLYALFLIATEASLLAFAVPHTPSPRRVVLPLVVSGRTLAAVSAVTTVGLIALVYGRAAEFVQEKSLYLAHNEFDSVTINVYAILLYLASMTSALGTVLLFDGGKGRLITALGRRRFGVACAVIAMFLVAFRSAMGSKGVSLQTLLFAGLFYIANTPRPKYVALGAVAIPSLVLMGIADATRGKALPDLLETLSAPGWDLVVEGFHNVIASGEKLAAHMSLYAVLDRGFELTGGSSVISLVASAIPQFLWPSRPEPIYTYYHETLSLPSNQGFTIHHAAGWYLNFGSLGVVMGGLTFGAIWSVLAALPRRNAARPRTSRFRRCIAAIAPFVFVSAIPALMRNGMEGYKTLVMELIGLAVVVRLAFVAGGRWVPSQSQAEVVVRAHSGTRWGLTLPPPPRPAMVPGSSPPCARHHLSS